MPQYLFGTKQVAGSFDLSYCNGALLAGAALKE